MEIIMPLQNKQNAVHPVAIFKQSWQIASKNLGRLGVIYLAFYLPLTILSLSPVVSSIPHQKLTLAAVMWYLFLFLASSWGQIALLLSVDKALGAQDYEIGQSINQAKAFLVKFLILSLSVALFAMGIILIADIFVVLISVFLAPVNKILAILGYCALFITVLFTFVFFLLRWSLAGLICVLENLWPPAALKRSFSLINKNINPVAGTYGLMILFYLAALLPLIIAGIWLGRSQGFHLGITIYMTVINSVLMPFWVILTVALYKKLKEGSETNVHA